MEDSLTFTFSNRVKRNFVRFRYGMSCLVFIFVSFDHLVWAHERITDQVTVTVNKGRLLGIHSGEGIARLSLAAGEDIVAIKAKGLTGFVQTSARLLGYSGTFQRWSERRLDVSEHIHDVHVTPRLVLVVGEQHVYGFHENAGQWKVESLRPRETPKHLIVQDHVAVIITNHQAFGFSAFTGGFFSKDLPLTDTEIRSEANDNIVILHLSDRQLVFRSGLAIWTELR